MKDGNRIPKPIRDALESYANHICQESEGYGETVDVARHDWDEKRNNLIRWLKSAKERKSNVVHQKQPSDVEICKVLMKIFLEDEECEKMEGDVTQYVITKTIEHFKGIVDPKRIKEISEEMARYA